MRPIVPLAAALLCGAASAGAAAQSLPRWHAARDLRFGGESAEYAFSYVADLRVGADGSIYVADAATIRAFDPRGRFRRWMGRAGAGPGEFRSVDHLGWRGDTLYAVDGNLRRVTFFAPGGGAPRTLQVAAPAVGELFAASVPLALFPDGAGLVRPLFGAQTAIDGRVPRIPLLRITRDGVVQRTVGRVAFADHPLASIRYPGGATFLFRPVSGESLLAVAPDGSAFFVVDRPVPRRSGTATFRVAKIRPRGDTTYVRSFRAPAVAVPRAAADSLLDRQVTALSPGLRGTGVPVRASIREAMAVPGFQPTVSAVVAGRDGTLWLRRESLGRPSVEWTVLDPAGRPVARVELPAAVRLYDADRGQLWGVELDDLDVPWIVRYALRPATGSTASR